MKNLKVLFTVLCVACATAVWGETVSQTYTLSNSDNGQDKATGDVTWAIGTGAITAQSNNMKLTGTITVTLPAGATLTSVEIAKTNTWGNGATVVFASGTTTLNTFSNSGTFTLTKNKTDLVYTFTKSGTSSKNAWVKTIKVTYESGSTKTTYSVTFNAGTNGTCSITSLTETSQGLGVTLPNCNPKTGYTFVGWSTSSSATSADAGKAGETYYPKENCTLYAVYSAVQNYTVTWVVGSNPSKTQSYTTQVASGSNATPPAELTLTGSEIGDCVDTFVGWSKSTLKSPADNNTPPSDLFTDESPEAITANTTFYAVFARKQ